MARVGRSRSRIVSIRGSSAQYNQNGVLIAGPFFQTVVNNSTCVDSHGRPIKPSAFSSSQRSGTMFLDGYAVNDSDQRVHVFEGLPFQLGSGETSEMSPLPVKSGWELDLIAGTNPSRPVFTPPQVLQDLITLPRLIKETGSLLRKPKKLMSAREVANAHLAARFGWAPLIEDLIKITKLQSTILKRNKELTQLYSGGGLKRRLKFNEDTKITRQAYTYAMYAGGTISVQIHTTVRKKQWGTSRWHPTAPPPYHPDDESKNRFVLRLITGLTVEGMARGTWDVIPWTWLLGWFTNVGKYTLLHSNTVPATWSELCLMNQVAKTSVPGLVVTKFSKVNDLEASGAFSHVTRSRIVGSSTILPGLNMPYLDMSRLSVLASLFVQRMR